MPVWIVLAREPGNETYVVGVFASERHANEKATRYRRRRPAANVVVQRYWVIDGGESQ